MSQLDVLVVLPVEERHKQLLESKAPEYVFHYMTAEEATKELIAEMDIIIGNVNPKRIKGSERVKWVQLNSAGADGYTIEGILPKGAFLTNATGAYGLAISEHMLASLLCVMKNLHLYAANQKNHEWKDEGPITSIYGSKTLVVGYGNIGQEFGKRMHALGSQVIGIRRNAAKKPDELVNLYQMDQFMECLKDADIVANCLPRTKETANLFNAEAFSQMKQGAYFLNVGRGNTVDSKALADALNAGHLGGAALDVTYPEPLPANNELWDAKNLLITPHVSGGFHLQETFERIVKIAAENLEHFVKEEPLNNIVDYETGYRKFGTEIQL